jgi:hypothetical protein
MKRKKSKPKTLSTEENRPPLSPSLRPTKPPEEEEKGAIKSQREFSREGTGLSPRSTLD